MKIIIQFSDKEALEQGAGDFEEAKGQEDSILRYPDVGSADKELTESGADVVITEDFYWATMLLARGQPVIFLLKPTIGQLVEKVRGITGSKK